MKSISTGKTTQSAHGLTSASNPSILLEKLNARRSTPDSEALASSEDEADLNRHESHPPAVPAQKPTRRPSWLNDTTQPVGQPRKGSFASSSMSPTTSHPSTPSAESGSWVPHMSATPGTSIGRGHSGSTSFPWGSGIWNPDTRKEPPSRLTEVLPSPTSLTPGISGNGVFVTESNFSKSNPNSRDQGPNTTIPFAIPLHPTPKTYRSQSYSVGQLDPDSSSPGSGTAPPPGFTGRGRGSQHSGLQHRPSRPSMLSEMSNEVGLGKLKEVEDDDNESPTEPTPETQMQGTQAKALEMLARENAMLRQQNYHTSMRLRPRSATNNATHIPYAIGGQYGYQDALAGESDYAIDELDEINELQDITNKGLLGRRLSEYGTSQAGRAPGYFSLENRKLESVKRAYWQSSLGFGGASDMPQSRRHSFADVPSRHGSISSIADTLPVRDDQGQDNVLSQDHQNRIGENSNFPLNEHAVSYFGGNGLQPRNQEPYTHSAYPSMVYQSYALNNPYNAARPSSPHRAMYGATQPRHNQLLYIVLFKCSRADVFYVQEGTGLTVKPGDLVIVEADRGTDLGTVAQDNVDWAQAKDLKEHYAEEHYKWLMMYSQGAAGTADGTGAGLMAASNGLQGSAVGGMGPASQHGMQEPNPGELKPKIIKRLAQNHEIQALRDKEGNEAKAKRVCMQKVKEHGLHMEILDAEFQMDWKKLTFYYFADAYINFNSLVTDLFKVYKTRIWMSAINAASFASPSLGLQAPSGIGPGAIGVSRPMQPDRRANQQEQAGYNSSSQSSRVYQSGLTGTFSHAVDAGSLAPTAFQHPAFAYGYPSFAAAPRSGGPSIGGYPSTVLPQIDPFTAYATPSAYPVIPPRFPSPHGINITHNTGDYERQGNSHPPGSDGWLNSFQSLSLNSR